MAVGSLEKQPALVLVLVLVTPPLSPPQSFPASEDKQVSIQIVRSCPGRSPKRIVRTSWAVVSSIVLLVFFLCCWMVVLVVWPNHPAILLVVVAGVLVLLLLLLVTLEVAIAGIVVAAGVFESFDFGNEDDANDDDDDANSHRNAAVEAMRGKTSTRSQASVHSKVIMVSRVWRMRSMILLGTITVNRGVAVAIAVAVDEDEDVDVLVLHCCSSSFSSFVSCFSSCSEEVHVVA